MQTQFCAVLNRLHHLITLRDLHADSSVADHAVSRMDVIMARLDELSRWLHLPSTAGRWRLAIAELTQMMDSLQSLLERAVTTESEWIRFAALNELKSKGLPRVLDPGSTERLRQLDRQPLAEIEAARCRGENPFLPLKPRFSCWAAEPASTGKLSVDDLPLTLLSIAEQQRIATLMRERTGGASDLLSCSIRCDASTRQEDVEAVLQLLLQLPDNALDRLAYALVEILPLRAGSATAKRLFGDRPLPQQVRYCAGSRLLVLTTEQRGDGCVVPSADPAAILSTGASIPAPQSASSVLRPAPFWVAIGRVLAPDQGRRAFSSAEEEAPVGGRPYGRDGFDCLRECRFDHAALKGFLKALVDDAAADDFQMDLGQSEAEAQAIACGLYLSGQCLTPALQDFMAKRFRREPAFTGRARFIIASQPSQP